VHRNMQLDHAQREFSVRYYQWALNDWEREIQQDFAFLRTFKGGASWQALEMMSGMDADEQRLFARALVKRFQKEALQITGERITPEEQRLVSRYCERTDSSPAELLLHERELRGECNVYAEGKELRKVIKTQLAGLDMERIESPATLWRYTTPVQRWSVLTEIQTTGRYAQVVYHHDIVLADERERVALDGGQIMEKYISLSRFISLHSWLGVSSQTEWCDLVDSDLPQVAKALVDVCARFLEVAPKLLSGL
jgi:hypothetical protein